MEALEAHVLPSSRLANEAAGTTIRFIQASASPPLPLGHELRTGVYQCSGLEGEAPTQLHFSVDASEPHLSPAARKSERDISAHTHNKSNPPAGPNQTLDQTRRAQG
jgi:hypothetical protein